jgi:spore coat polysaccharide biosynthesis protein SpsF (cytidylyltransferase family)
MKHQNYRIVAIIQARIGATRLPEKILKDVSGKPMLWHVIKRLKFSQMIDDIVLAIPTSDQNDSLEDFAKELKLHCFRGSETDVLSRYYGAAVKYGGDVIVRVTADCPLIDPRVTDWVIDAHLNSGADYTTNDVEYGFPRGLDTEALNFDTLARAYGDAKLDYEREHVTTYIYQHPDLFKLNFVEAKGKLRRPDLRLTVDTEEDLEFIREIFKQLYRDDQTFYTEDVIEFLDQHPELIAINAHVRQKELGG